MKEEELSKNPVIDAKLGENPRLPPWIQIKFVHISEDHVRFCELRQGGKEHYELVDDPEGRNLNAGLIVRKENTFFITCAGAGVLGRDGRIITEMINVDPDLKKEWNEETRDLLNTMYEERATFITGDTK